ncbi:hypothetical protein Sste5346_003717 [Sporothrix stenoceras]|uniref:Alcohol acetyltransferase n=1 Tax=Sporothrix stenoceras TaxID=5173 RepID=A0ABR3ZB19_9PEZI
MALQRTVLRPLGGYEQYSSSRHSLGLYQNVITVCRYALPSSLGETETETGKVEAVKENIRHAVTTIVLEKLPALRVGIEGEDTKSPVFVALPSIDLGLHIELVNRSPGLSPKEEDDQLMRDLEKETARPFLDVATHSPWRLVVYLNTAENWADVGFAVHHALADGKSGLIFHTHLVETLNTISSEGNKTRDDTSDVLEFTEIPVLVPTQEELVKFTISWPFFLRTVWKELGPAWLKSTPVAGPYTGSRVTLEPKLKGNLRIFHLSSETVGALLAACRAHNTTLTALVHGLLLVLFARRFPADVASSFLCAMPMSMRPYIQAPPDMVHDVNRSMANLVSPHMFTYETELVEDGRAVGETDADDDDKVWRAAVAVGTSLKARQANVTDDNPMGLMGYVSDWHDWWRKHEGKVRDSTWAVSNTGSISPTGSVDAGTAGWRLLRNFYAQSSIGKDSLIGVNIGGVRGGEVSVVVGWHHGVTEDAFANLFTDDLHACLLRFGTTGYFSVPGRLHE